MFLRKVQGDQQSYNGHRNGMVPVAIIRAVRLWLVSRQVSPGHHTDPRLPLLTIMNQLDTSGMSRDQQRFTAVALIDLPGCGSHLTVTDIRIRS